MYSICIYIYGTFATSAPLEDLDYRV
jgi:hypothetical protein